MDDLTTEIGWYVSDVHCRRAIDYLNTRLVSEGYLKLSNSAPMLQKMWGEALTKTMDVREPSPIGPDPELARKLSGKSYDG